MSSIAYEIRQALNRLCEVRGCLEVGGKGEDEGVAVPAVYLVEFGDVALQRGWGTGKDGAQVESCHCMPTHVSGHFLFDDVHHGWQRQSTMSSSTVRGVDEHPSMLWVVYVDVLLGFQDHIYLQ